MRKSSAFSEHPSRQNSYIMGAWACILLKCSTIKKKIIVLSNVFQITYWRAWQHPCKASGMNSYLEHVFTARPVAEQRIPVSFDAISPMVDAPVALGTEESVLVLCWKREGGESMANDQEQASACCFFFFLPSHLWLQHPWNTQETVSSSCLRKTQSYAQLMVMKSLCAWKTYSWSSLRWEDRSSQTDLGKTK